MNALHFAREVCLADYFYSHETPSHSPYSVLYWAIHICFLFQKIFFLVQYSRLIPFLSYFVARWTISKQTMIICMRNLCCMPHYNSTRCEIVIVILMLGFIRLSFSKTMMTSSIGNISAYWPSVRRIHRWPVNHRSPVHSSHKGQWRGALIFSLICTWTNSWANNGDAVDLRCRRAHYDVTVMKHVW